MAVLSSSASDRSQDGRALRIQLLGPLRLWRGDVELDPGPRQQASLLAVLLARADQPVSRAELIDLMWDDEAPSSAVNVIHKCVGSLRRVLEPGLSARAAGSYLQRRGDGYLFGSRNSGLDLIAFREHLKAARLAADQEQHGTSLDRFIEALALWHGPAGEGLGLGLVAAPGFVALNSEFLEACVAAADLAVRFGQPQRVLPALHLAVSMAPLDEGVHAALVASLGAAGRRAEAFATWRAVRARLAEELGVDPGPILRAAQQQILAETVAPAETGRRTAGASAAAASGLIGRTDELGKLRDIMRLVLAGGTGVVIVDGEPGVGKTRLLNEVTAQADRAGALTVLGMCLEGDGTPAMWPWVKVVGALLDAESEGRAERVADELRRFVEPPKDDGPLAAPPDSGTRFRLFEQVVALVSRVAAQRPVAVVIDDLQWADTASLQLFSHLSAQLPAGTVIFGALRDRAPMPSTELSRHLATVSRAPRHHRIHLDPMNRAEVAELVRRETATDAGADAIHSIYARTAGNPFFVRELSRLLADTGAITIASASGAEVPVTVRDVVRSRTAHLEDDVRRLLQLAALIGRDTTLTLLAHAADIDAATCLDRIEPLAALGVLEPTPADAFSFRFPHDLVRESVAQIMPPRQAAELHLRIADALESSTADDDSATERLAFHLLAAGPLGEPSRTAAALVRAGRRAASKSAFEAAERQLQSAIQVARAAGLAELELSAVAPLATVFWRQAGFSGSYTDLLTRAEHLARRTGQDAKAADFLFMRVVAGFSQHHPETEILVGRLIEEGKKRADSIMRAYSMLIQGLIEFDQGNAGQALRHMEQDDWTALDDTRWRQDNPLRRDLRMVAPLFRAVMMAVNGDIDDSRALLDTVESAVADDAYAIAVWAHWATNAAEWAGDPAWALAITRRWEMADPHHLFINVDPYRRVSRCWARALTGDDPAAAAAEAEQVVRTTMLDPAMYSVSQYCALVAEMWLAAERPDEAASALDQADRLADAHNERFTEPLRRLLRARVLQARGESADVVRAAAAQATTIATERGTNVIARRAEELIISVSSPASD